MLYRKDHKNKARFVLGNCLASEKALITVGINPSIASDTQSDPTWSRVQKMAAYKGFGGAILINIYPQRATYIKDLPPHRANYRLHRTNLTEIQRLILPLSELHLWAAWGNLIEARKYFPACLKDIYEVIQSKTNHWYCLDQVTERGHPKHPLARGKNAFRYEQAFQSFDMNQYLKKYFD